MDVMVVHADKDVPVTTRASRQDAASKRTFRNVIYQNDEAFVNEAFETRLSGSGLAACYTMSLTNDVTCPFGALARTCKGLSAGARPRDPRAARDPGGGSRVCRARPSERSRRQISHGLGSVGLQIKPTLNVLKSIR